MRHGFLGLVPAIVFALAARSEALTNVRFETWDLGSGKIAHDIVAPRDTVSYVGVSFDATSTAGDLAGGFHFSIAERDPGVDQVLIRLQVGPCSAVAPVGSEIYVSVSVAVYCDRDGNLHARDARSPFVTWCDYPTPQVCGFDTGRYPPAALPAVSEPELFELAVLDENDQEGPHPTPEDALRCAADAPIPPLLGSGALRASIEGTPPREYPRSGAIGVFADPGGTLCVDHIEPLVPFRWYVVARLDGLTRCGLTVAILAIHGLPPGFFITSRPNPDAFNEFGDPFTLGGVLFQCERGPGDAVVLYTLDGISTSPLQDLVLEVAGGTPPEPPFSRVKLCASYNAPYRRMDTSRFFINPSHSQACDITVPVTRATWGQVKGLYRNAP